MEQKHDWTVLELGDMCVKSFEMKRYSSIILAWQASARTRAPASALRTIQAVLKDNVSSSFPHQRGNYCILLRLSKPFVHGNSLPRSN